VSHRPELAALLDSRTANSREGDVLGLGRRLGSATELGLGFSLGLGLEYAVGMALGLGCADGGVDRWA
jgi:hypothetical protein